MSTSTDISSPCAKAKTASGAGRKAILIGGTARPFRYGYAFTGGPEKAWARVILRAIADGVLGIAALPEGVGSRHGAVLKC